MAEILQSLYPYLDVAVANLDKLSFIGTQTHIFHFDALVSNIGVCIAH